MAIIKDVLILTDYDTYPQQQRVLIEGVRMVGISGVVPLTRNFGKDAGDIIGEATIYQKDRQIYANIKIADDAPIGTGLYYPAVMIEWDKKHVTKRVVKKCTIRELALTATNVDPTIKAIFIIAKSKSGLLIEYPATPAIPSQ